MTENYDALGRYHAAMTKLKDLSARRHNALTRLIRQLERSRHDEGLRIHKLPGEWVQRLLNEILDIDDQLCQCIGEANLHAGESGQPPVRWLDVDKQ